MCILPPWAVSGCQGDVTEHVAEKRCVADPPELVGAESNTPLVPICLLSLPSNGEGILDRGPLWQNLSQRLLVPLTSLSVLILRFRFLWHFCKDYALFPSVRHLWPSRETCYSTDEEYKGRDVARLPQTSNLAPLS